MRIIFDAYELIAGQGKSQGIYNYAKNLVKNLISHIEANNELIILCNISNIQDFSFEHPLVHSVLISKKIPNIFIRLCWYYGLAAITIKGFNGDIYFSPKGFLPKLVKWFSPKIKTAIVIHDLIPLWYAEHFPAYFGKFEELFINRALINSIIDSDAIIAISNATAQDIKDRLGRIQGINVVHNGIAITNPSTNSHPEPYIFAMTSRLPHKNAAGILAAYREYRSISTYQPLPLIVCGLSDISEPGVITIKGIDDPTLHAYYANAALFIFLSLTEGFGFPPMEALAHGTSVLCSDIPVLREVAQDLAYYVDPADSKQIAEKIIQMLDAEETTDNKTAKVAILEQFSWEKASTAILEILKNLNDEVLKVSIH